MIRYLSGIVLLLLFSVNSFAQNFSITGVVKDNKGETLPGAGIYLSGYTTATVTNNSGQFTLSKLKPGSYEVVVQMMGFLPFSKSVIISDKSVEVTLVLSENTVQLNEVVIRVDPNRERNYQVFKEYFIGKTPNSEKCTILNPQVLDIRYDGDNKILTVTSNEFLVVENKALGYRLKYMLNLFEYDYNKKVIYFSGLPVFEDLKGSGSKRRKWLKSREIAYRGSPQHFFQSLYFNKVQEEGFIIYKRIKIPNPARPSDSLLAVTKARLYKKMNRSSKIIVIDDSMQMVNRQINMPKELATLDMSGVNTDTLVKMVSPTMKAINYKDELYVMYTKEEESVAYSNTGHYVMRPLTIPNYEISVVRLLQGPVRFYPNGSIYDPKSMLFEGFWAYEKIGDMIPIDYVPLKTK